MSLKASDVWARLNPGNILDPDTVAGDVTKTDGWACGQADPRYMNWVLNRLCQSAVKVVQEWNPNVAAYGGYVHPAWVTGSTGSIYRSVGPLSNLNSDPVTDGGVNWADLFGILIPYPPLYLEGFYWTNNGALPNTDIDIGPGSAQVGAATADQSGTISKKLNLAWSLGGAGGLRGTGVAYAANTDYPLHVIVKADGTVDFGVDLAANLPNAPTLVGVGGAADGAGFVFSRHIGWVQTDGANNIVQIVRDGDLVRYLGVDVVDALNPADNTAVTSRVPPNTIAILMLSAENTAASATGLQCAIKTGPVGVALGVPSNVDHDFFFRGFNSTGNFTGASSTQILRPVNANKQYLQRFANTGAASNIRHFSKGYIFNRVRA